MIETKITLDDAELAARLRSLDDTVIQPRRLMARLAGSVERSIKDHFIDKDRKPRRQGWPRSHFWRREGERKTHISSIGNSTAKVSVASEAVAAHHRGATIRPRGKALAIPLRPEVAHKLPSANPVPGLSVVVWKGARRAFLATNDNNRLTLWYVLVKRVTLNPDPNTLPSDRDLSNLVQAETRNYINERNK